MTSDLITFKVGTRSSKLALVQTRAALRKLEECLPGCRFEDVALSSPGDRDLGTDLRESSADFFTRDLDDRVLSGELDCALHSAKDVPDPVADGLDWFWLPWREDPRDALILPPGKGLDELPERPRIGVSSARREAYCTQRFPKAVQGNIRGDIGQRLDQLDRGDFDMLVMAAAALVRLGLEDRITEWISPDELPPPDGQGYLCMTFKDGDERFLRMRALFVKTVTFAAGGIGSTGTCTLEVLKAVERCDTCLHDALMGQEILDRLPPGALRLPVGKRAGRHSLPQPEITELIARYARRGCRVVRLKGGDPGVFGRLAEEVDALDRLAMPYRALPGVSSLTASTTGTGMLLTRRGLSRGFCVMTPRKEGGGRGPVDGAARAELPIVFYMSVSVAGDLAAELMADGMDPTTPAVMVFGSGTDQCYTIAGVLADIGEKLKERDHDLPGTLIIGKVAAYRYRTEFGALEGKRVLLTCSESLQDKAAGLVSDYGGVPVCRPLIRLVPTAEGRARVCSVDAYDWVVLTSPSAVRCFGDLVRQAGIDLRRVPKLVSCGGGTSDELAAMGLRADIEPQANFGAEGLLETAIPLVTQGLKILRLRSDKAGPSLAGALREHGADVVDCVLYDNLPIEYDPAVPEFDDVFFASASAVEVFDAQWGRAALNGKLVLAIGKPTLAALEKRGRIADLVGAEATVESSIGTLARHYVCDNLIGISRDRNVAPLQGA